jgi:NAD(P)-dependent dehydrogenase (short-subunit alcohol dehydrogenase family)
MAKVKEARDRVALITGAGSGIGRATVARLLDAGWKVAAVDRDKAIAMAGEALSRIDGVVNSAGIAADIPALDTPVDLFRKMLDVNVVGTFIVARAAARLMRNTGGGSIVNISSVAGLRGAKGRSAYGASKGAVIVLTQVLANDLAPHSIRVNAVAPGPVDTPMAQAMHSERDRAQWLRHIPMRRYARPDEIANVIEFLLDGTRSSYVTGEIVAVDGGFRGAGILAEEQ